MKKKVIIGLTILALLVTITGAWAYSTSTSFSIEIEVDTTIFIPTVDDSCGTGNNNNKLEFEPGITGLDDPEAIAIDTCASDTAGDWSVVMDGNVPLNLTFALSNAAPTGVTVAISNECASPYTTSNELNLTTEPTLMDWAKDLSDASELEIWQRVGADTTATGDSGTDLSIEVTSSYNS